MRSPTERLAFLICTSANDIAFDSSSHSFHRIHRGRRSVRKMIMFAYCSLTSVPPDPAYAKKKWPYHNAPCPCAVHCCSWGENNRLSSEILLISFLGDALSRGKGRPQYTPLRQLARRDLALVLHPRSTRHLSLAMDLPLCSLPIMHPVHWCPAVAV